MSAETKYLSLLRKRLLDGLLSGIGDLIVNGDMDSRLAGNLNVSIPGVNGEALIMRLAPISVSSGSACTSSVIEPSHVLAALGLAEDLAYASIRFGIGRFNTSENIDAAIELVCSSVKKLRKLNQGSFNTQKGKAVETYN